MTFARARDLLTWRPNARERKLLLALAAIACTAFALSAREAAREAASLHADAVATQQRIRTQYASLSGVDLQARLAAQKLLLSALRMTDQTPDLSRLRMREELGALADRAGLTNVTFPEDAGGNLEPAAPAGGFTIVETSLEADFDPAALTGLLRELQDFHRAYLIEAIDCRLADSPARMSLRFRILHQRTGRQS
jgi:hypothetical protein